MKNQYVYVSYRQPATKSVRRIIDKITASFDLRTKHNVIAVMDDREWPESRRAIDDAALVLVVIDENWLKADDEYGRRLIDSDHDRIKKELLHALEMESKAGWPIVCPVIVGRASMPPRDALPRELWALTDKKQIRVDDDLDLDKLEVRISEILDEQKLSSFTAPRGEVSARDIQIDWLSIKNFRGFRSIDIDFTPESTLSGNWTCVSGINGAGKSTILQAIALLLLGPKNVMELGFRRLSAMQRKGGGGNLEEYFLEDTHLRAGVRLFGKSKTLELVIDRQGPKLEFDKPSQSAGLEGLLFLAYGASRNLSDSLDRHDDLSEETQGVISLFDPMAQLGSARALFDGDFGRAKKANHQLESSRKLFQNILELVFDDAVSVNSVSDTKTNSMKFLSGKSLIEVFDLPDGYRSTAAWMADLCIRWLVLNPNSGTSPSDIQGIVLIDELDLHLHASLQRGIVSRLRKALPNVQWIITSHAPLILASFDRNEIVALDQDMESGYRVPREQIYGFSADQVYNYIFHISPVSELSEIKIGEIGSDESNARLAELKRALGTIDDSEARQRRLERIKSRISNLKK